MQSLSKVITKCTLDSRIFYRTPINYLLVNLAVADMVVATFFAPMHIFVHTFTHPDGFTGTLLCKFLTGGAFAWTGGASSVFTLVAISVERYYAVNYPHGNKGKLTHNKLKVCLSLDIVTNCDTKSGFLILIFSV